MTHMTSPGRYQCLAQAIQPDQTSLRIKHAPPAPETLLEKPKINGRI